MVKFKGVCSVHIRLSVYWVIYKMGVYEMSVSSENTNWGQSVTGVVIKDGKVLLARHTYGSGKNMLIIPGGYVNFGETPQEGVKREFMADHTSEGEAIDVFCIRVNMPAW